MDKFLHPISLVIPVYNEAGNLLPLHHEITEVLSASVSSYEIIYVDDGSIDASLGELCKIQEADPHVVVIQFRRNFGQTSAFAAGIDRASGDYIVTLDADGQNNPADIPKLLAETITGDYDFVTGWRTNRKE